MGSIVKVIEVIAQSDRGFEDAVQAAVAEAGGKGSGIRSVWVNNLSAKVENGRVTQYRVNAKLSCVEGEKP